MAAVVADTLASCVRLHPISSPPAPAPTPSITYYVLLARPHVHLVRSCDVLRDSHLQFHDNEALLTPLFLPTSADTAGPKPYTLGPGGGPRAADSERTQMKTKKEMQAKTIKDFDW